MDLSKNSNIVITNEWFHLSYRLVSWIIMGLLCCLGVMAWMGWQLLHIQPIVADASYTAEWQENLESQSQQLKALEGQTRQRIELLTQHIGRVEANVIRLNGLGERVVSALKLDPQEFNFQDPLQSANPANPLKDKDPILFAIKELDAILEKRHSQLSTLLQVAHTHSAVADLALKGSGNPVKGGYVSSFYGYRKDPINGGKAWHAGVDVAGKEGSEIKALAGGIVSYSATKGGYGRLVEINHGNGLVTRYGHNKSLLVQRGQLVHKGDTIALLGNSGRSTGPHVHLEVHKDGEVVDPGRFFPDLMRS